MYPMHRLFFCLGLGTLVLTVAGCASNSISDRDIHQFSPAPMVRVGAQQLPPVSTTPVHELLRDADRAFQAAEAAQARGDRDGARQHYVKMLELVEQAGLDPVMFSQVRQEFARFAKEDDPGLYERYFARGGVIRAKHGEMSVLQVPMPLPQPVIDEIELLQNRHRRSFQIALNRSYRYLPYLQGELEKAGLPPQLAYVAMVESHFTPKIDSHAGAGGMWQFMPATARRYQLRQDQFVDERYNWQSSTQAAIEYFKYLYEFFDGSWELAIAAYNMGEGGLSRAIEANSGERSFWKLIEEAPAAHRIKTETKRYVPKVLAYWIVASSPERYGFSVQPEAPENGFRVTVNGSYALDAIDRALELPSGTLATLNPDLIRGMTPSGGYSLTVPLHTREKVASALQSLDTVRGSDVVLASNPAPARGGSASGATGFSNYRVKRGDTLSQIAKRHGTTADELAKANNLRSGRHLRAGQNLRVPGGGAEAVASVERGSVTAASEATTTYRIRRGDTLYGIARDRGLKVEDIMAWNNLDSESNLRVGQELKLAAGTAPSAAPVRATAAASEAERGSGNARVHEVKAGEYPAKIAKIYGVPLQDFLSWNNLDKDGQILVGQRLLVHVTGAESTDDFAPTRKHVVQKGEYPAKIAANYGVKTADLLAWNNLSANSTIRVGQELLVRGGSTGSGGSTTATASGGADTATVHVVAKGEVLGKIAERYGVSTKDLMAWNKLSSANTLKVGQELVVRQSGGDSRMARNTTTARTHVVTKGNTPWEIAQKYGVAVDDLYRWNNWRRDHVLKIGERVVVNQ